MEKRTEKFHFDAVTRTLTITSQFAEKMANPESKEYALFLKFQRDFPGLRVVKKTHRTPSKYHNKNGTTTSRNQFKNVTFENMERFMKALPKSKEYLAEYNFLKETASALQINGYTIVRKWFMAQFPYFRSNPLFYISNNPAVVPAAEVIQAFSEEESVA